MQRNEEILVHFGFNVFRALVRRYLLKMSIVMASVHCSPLMAMLWRLRIVEIRKSQI